MKQTKYTVMLVEDNDDHAELVTRTFSDYANNISIKRYSDGEAALNFLMTETDEEVSPLPSLILLDLRLPKVDGIEVLRRIKEDERTRIIPVVILTSSDSDLDVVKAYSNFVNSYLVKPLEYSSFSALMDQINNYWLSSNRNPI